MRIWISRTFAIQHTCIAHQTVSKIHFTWFVIICIECLHFSADFQRIFQGISVKSDVPIVKAMLSIRPVNRKIDQLTLVGDGNSYGVKGMVRRDWVMEMSNLGTDQYNSTVWNEALNYPAYKLNIDVSELGGSF